ncbi:MAG: hypothetical protein PHF00_04785 [Elusimicrobia bacterium]|nr:hypothetical protein [Elusimicrobiota bacterium]
MSFAGARRGSILLETVLATLIITTVGVSLLALIQKSLVVSYRAREQMTCSRLAQSGMSRVKNMDFYRLFAADSGQANYGLWPAYPYKAVLDGFQTSLRTAKFDRFRVGVAFMRRDISDANGNGMTSDLMPFTDANNDKIDDYDSNIRYFDANADGDFYDTYTSGGRTVAEQPDTHIKKVTLDIFRRGRLACSQTELVSLEQFTGDPNPSSEASLALLISAPSNEAFLYDLQTAARQAAWDLPISKPYPADVARYRADAVSPLTVSGETDPLATVKLYVGDSGELAAPAADASGLFSASPAAVSSALIEGTNILRGQAGKDGYTSPIAQRALILDLAPPVIDSFSPAGATPNRAPAVGAALSDPGVSTTTTSGICPDVVALKINGAPVNFKYESGAVVWIDSTTGTVPVLATGTYSAVVEAGDYAGYKASATWSFTIQNVDTDHSAPVVAEKSPIGMAPSDLPELSVKVFDNQSGIIPASIVLKLDGAAVVYAADIGEHYDAAAKRVFFTPSSPFESGSTHVLEVTASHWATEPPEKVTSIDSWSFTVP